MENGSGFPGQHSHEPWLPSMINAWNEFNAAPVTNPSFGNLATPSGIALHVDVGALYAGYAMDFDGNGTVDLQVPPSGNLDLDNDGHADIGNLGTLGTGTPGGGNLLTEVTELTSPIPLDLFAAGSKFADLKKANFNSLRSHVFRYAIFGHWFAWPGGEHKSGIANCVGKCSDFLITLGGAQQQTVDANHDGVPDLGGAVLRGPSGLPVDGTMNQQTGTFLHELGHTMSLHHGGADDLNYKPNYLSIMNYTFQLDGLSFDFDGDRLGDALPNDFNGDGRPDLRRFQYSDTALEPLDETKLFEARGISLTGGNASTVYSCPAGFPVQLAFGSGTGNIDWNCNGVNAEPNVIADVNGDLAFTQLTGHDDYATVANDIKFQPGISLEQYRRRQEATQRIIALPRHEKGQPYCATPKIVDFEKLAGGKSVDAQFLPIAKFFSDAHRRPIIYDPTRRGGAPTSSGKNSLTNQIKEPVPLAIQFGSLQRTVSFFLGRGVSSLPVSGQRTRAVLKAFDGDGLNMGEITVPLPAPAQGVTQFMSAAAVYPDQLISRIELRYESGPSNGVASAWTSVAEPQQIDDLTLCETVTGSGVTPPVEKPPVFGDLPVHLAVDAVVLRSGTSSVGEAGHVPLNEQALVALPITLDGVGQTTDLVLTEKEGRKIRLGAPSTFGGAEFQYWRLDKLISFGAANREIDLTLLRDGHLTAVYVDRRQSQRPSKQPPSCLCEHQKHRPAG
jgi:hypothetical protein